MREPLVLCYHAIGDGWPSAVTARRLGQQVRILLRRGYKPVTFAEAVLEPDDRRRFAVSFDDAYASVLTHAFPVLADLGVPATVFAVSDYAEGGRPLDWPGLTESGVDPDPSARASLSWDELRHLAEAGWEIGSHTCTHPRLSLLDDEVLAHELVSSRWACEQALERPCRSIAYPYGDLDERVVAAAEAAGYEAGCALSIATSGRLAWPRVGVYGIDTPARFRLKVSPGVLRLRRALAARRVPAR